MFMFTSGGEKSIIKSIIIILLPLIRNIISGTSKTLIYLKIKTVKANESKCQQKKKQNVMYILECKQFSHYTVVFLNL